MPTIDVRDNNDDGEQTEFKFDDSERTIFIDDDDEIMLKLENHGDVITLCDHFENVDNFIKAVHMAVEEYTR